MVAPILIDIQNKGRIVAHVLFLCLFCSWQTFAQSNSPTLTLLSLSAHPDDEDGATLAYYSKIKGVKTYSIFFTRGEGGQNEIGSELGEELGVLRTKETLEAVKIIESDVFFLGFPDFGFSKTAKETFSMWRSKDSVLARLVYLIRALKPDVIITNHDTITTKPNRQHGNHQVVGISAYEAFEKAADPLFHPEQLNDDVTLWQAKKLFFRFLNRGNAPTDSLVTIDVSERNATGETIEQIALNSLNKHRSQGMDKITLDSMSPFFRQHKYYLVREEERFPFDSLDLFSGISSTKKQIPPLTQFPFPQIQLPEIKPRTTNEVTAQHAEHIVVGLVKTYDNSVEQTLSLFNINYELLDSNHLASDDLSKYSVILLDLRTYEYRPDAVVYNNRLLSYVNDGGNLICFYHKPNDWNGKNFAPYPITLTSERVTEENAVVSILKPEHEVFNSPNKISESDCSGWTQERNIYLPSDDTTKTSSRYERLLSMSDTEEQQPSTSLLFARYGKGTYTYCSLALYRQLRNMNEGAMKLFFNLLSLQKGK
ncbi:MAG: PIG-L family deacetylase [Ignavibacteriae bacterium]|nr:PIG-L family deacetylase [Ignavibacteriota bacterium]